MSGSGASGFGLTDNIGNFLEDGSGVTVSLATPPVGSTLDFISRMRRVLPAGWFPDTAPVLTALLTGGATAMSWLYSQVQYCALQTRIATATTFWLDIISQDFYGNEYPRQAGETDASFRARIQADFLPTRGTRPALLSELTAELGTAPQIIYAWNPGDVGAYNVGTSAYGTPGYNNGGATGVYGSLALNAQTFVYAPLPSNGATAAELYGAALYEIPAGAECWINTTPNPVLPNPPTEAPPFVWDVSSWDGGTAWEN